MAHRVHPKIFRIRELKNWNSRGFYEKNFLKFLEEDYKIREFLKKKFSKTGIIDEVEIERSLGRINIIISSARPGLIIGRGGNEIERLKQEIERKILKEKIDLNIEIKEIKEMWKSASLVAQWMAREIEKRVPYRRVLKQALSKIMAQKDVEGAKVYVGGRLDGIEIARKEWLKKGKLPRQTIRADIDYAFEEAYCSYGVIGVKVWIYKGEKF